MIFDSSIWEALTNCSNAASSALPEKPRPNSVVENDVPSFSYKKKLMRACAADQGNNRRHWCQRSRAHEGSHRMRS